MQRTTQDWLVLAVLTHHNARALGLVVGCQFAPQVLLLPWTGSTADHADRRRLLLISQALIGLCALGLSILVMAAARPISTSSSAWCATEAARSLREILPR